MIHIKEFDGLRALLASWVVVTHVIYMSHFTRLNRAMHAGVAVDIFIILSGFVIFNLLDRGETYGAYITRRFFRLFPAFFFSLIFAVLLSQLLPDWTPEGLYHAFYVADHREFFPHLAAHLTMLHGAVPEQILAKSSLTYLPPAWSISLEWQFYLFAPVLFAFMKRPTWRLVAVVLLLVGVRVLWMKHRLGPPFVAEISFGYFRAFLPLKVELFLLGGLSFFVWKWLSARQETLKLRADWLTILILPMVYFLTRSIALALWCSFFLALVGHRFGQPTLLTRCAAFVLRLRSLQWLGMVSYSLYIVHWPVLVLLHFGIQHMFPRMGTVPKAILLGVSGYSASVALAGVMYVWLEKPCIDYARELTSRWRTGNRKLASTVVAKDGLIWEI